jgi:hypothetical protein
MHPINPRDLPTKTKIVLAFLAIIDSV